jgi:hypothetical protein
MKLVQDGHRVRLATHECYRQYVQSFGGGGLEFFPLAGDPVKLSEFMVKTHGNILPTNADVIKQVRHQTQMWGVVRGDHIKPGLVSDFLLDRFQRTYSC